MTGAGAAAGSSGSPNSAQEEPCLKWIELVDEYCPDSKSDSCSNWQAEEASCLSHTTEDYRKKVEKARKFNKAIRVSSKEMPSPTWIKFYSDIEALQFPIHYSKEFNYPHAHPDLPIRRQDLGSIVKDAIRSTIKPEYDLPVSGAGMDISADDHSRNKLIVRLNFTFVPREAIQPLTNSLLIITYEIKKANKDSTYEKRIFNREGLPAPPPAQPSPTKDNLPRILVVQGDGSAFRERLNNTLSEIIFEATKSAICFRAPQQAFCNSFYASHKGDSENGQ